MAVLLTTQNQKPKMFVTVPIAFATIPLCGFGSVFCVSVCFGCAQEKLPEVLVGVFVDCGAGT